MFNNVTDKTFIFHEEETLISDGNILTISTGSDLINIEITGTSTDMELKFYGKVFEDWYEVSAINLKSFILCSSCSEVNQLVQVDLTGLIELKVKIESINNGNVSVKGRVIT